MLRSRLPHPDASGNPLVFRPRGTGGSRLETLADAVFAFAVTLLVVSLEVPQTYDELRGAMSGFVAFGVSFAMLISLWLYHYLFFRRYNLQDGWTIALNAVLLFLVLFYVYPLKFLSSMFVGMITGSHGPTVQPDGSEVWPIQLAQIPELMMIYGLGYALIFLVFGLLYANAYRQRNALGLNAAERVFTWGGITSNALQVAIGSTSVVLASFGGRAAVWAGWVYMLIGPVMGLHGWNVGRRVRATAEPDAAPIPECGEIAEPQIEPPAA